MTNILKVRILSLLLILGLGFGISTGANAQIAGASEPEVSVKNITLNQTQYDSGATVTGTFSLTNMKAENVSEVFYRVSLVGDYQLNGLAKTVYDTKSYGPVFLSPNQSKTLNLSYALPNGVGGGGLGIQVRAVLKSGASLSWSDAPVTVNGGQAEGFPVVITRAAVSVHNKSFDVQEGPTLYKGEKGTLQVTLSNSTAADITVTPKINYHTRSSVSTPITTNKGTAVVIKASGLSTYSLDLPVFDAKGGVYVGSISFLNDKGVVQAQPFEFRYIVAGNIVTIHSVATDVQTVTAGDPVDVTIHYSGAPYDIEDGKPTGDGNADLTVTLYNEHNEVVGTYEEKMNFNLGESKTVRVGAAISASRLMAKVTVTKDGGLITSYDAGLTDPDSGASSREKALFYLLFAVAALILLGLVVRHMKVAKTTTMAVFLALAFFGISHQAEAWNVIDSETHNCATDYGGRGYCWPPDSNFVPSVTVSTPSGNLAPGERFFLMGSLNARACLNRPQDIKFTITTSWDNRTYTYIQRKDQHGGHQIILNYFDFSYGVTATDKFTAPTTPGEYKITLRVDNYLNIPDKNSTGQPLPKEKALRGWVLGEQKFKVVDNNPPEDPTKGDVEIISVNNNGQPYPAHNPRLVSRFWADQGGTGVYLRSNVTQATSPSGNAWFRNLTAGSGYTSSVGIYPHASGQPTYTVVSLGSFKRFLAFSGDFLKNIAPLKAQYALAAQSCTIPEVGAASCTYDRGNANGCTPAQIHVTPDQRDNIYTRYYPGDTAPCLDHYFAPSDGGSFSVVAGKVTRIVFQWGLTGGTGDFDFDLGVGPDKVVAPGGSTTNTASVTKTDGDNFDEVTLSIVSVSGTGVTATLDETCSANCLETIQINASASAVPGSIHVVRVRGTTNDGLIKEKTFNVTISNAVGDLLIIDCWPSVINPLTGNEIDHTPVAAVNQLVTWKSQVQGGIPPYSYTWSGSENLSGDGPTTTKRYGRIGTKIANLEVTDSSVPQLSDQMACEIRLNVSLNPDWGQF